MAGVVSATVNHFTHNHPLTKYVDGEECVCGLCKVPIRLARYGCKTCNFYLHELCATSPGSLLASMHPQHELTLARLDKHFCNLCGDPVEGMFYRCEECDFDLHPLCSQVTDCLQHVLHRDHPLSLYKFKTTPTSPPPCLLCNDKCTHLFYKCETGTCGVCIHLDCIQPNTWTIPVKTTRVLAQTTAVQAQVPAQRHVRRRDKFLGIAGGLALNLVGAEMYEHVKELKEFIGELCEN